MLRVRRSLAPFAYVRKQSLISDMVAHAALPGALLAFLTAVVVLGVNGRNLLGLILGALVRGTLAALFANSIAARTKTRIDTAICISLTVFFGAVARFWIAYILNAATAASMALF